MYLEVDMFKAVSKMLVIAMMLVAFVGQAIAFNASMPCETSEDSHSPNVSKLVKDYDSSPTSTDNEEDCCGIECCDLNCTCIANACSSVVYFNIEVSSTKTPILSGVAYIQQPKQTKSIVTLLYRPPIFIS